MLDEAGTSGTKSLATTERAFRRDCSEPKAICSLYNQRQVANKDGSAGMESLPCAIRYQVFGISRPSESSLFIDYVAGSIEQRRATILSLIAHGTDAALKGWCMFGHLSDSDVFEIESVPDQVSAEDAVQFWRAYFGSLGEEIVSAKHICDDAR
ncbi:hypothetical protein [Paraburkholderia sp. J8-2]|uniref:hypothetical protein n=1 Tax=Paraburkholderia sp. J8-2 TaxID=2805440 RepID=UPI002AB5EDEC|nr:hypothetical protein [Paraburkholderia sp. J8-2]